MKSKTKKVLCWVVGGLVVTVGLVVAYKVGYEDGHAEADAIWDMTIRMVGCN